MSGTCCTHSERANILFRLISIRKNALERSLTSAQTTAQVGAAQTASAAAPQRQLHFCNGAFFLARVFEHVDKCDLITNTAINMHGVRISK